VLADDRVSDADRHEDISRAVAFSLVATAEEDRNRGLSDLARASDTFQVALGRIEK